MKISSWNCNMAFRKKAEYILQMSPDILVVPECENPLIYPNDPSLLRAAEQIWIGDNKSKGLGVFSYSDYKFTIFDDYNPEFRYILPIHVNGPVEFNLFAVWNMNNRENPEHRYIAQLWLALNYYEPYLNEPTIICGDFNSNVIWDNEKPRRVANHSKVVTFLEEKGIYSTYHEFFGEEQGGESRHTLYMYRKPDKPYHIDYCFASKNFIDRLGAVEVGKFDQWIGYSDHMPISATFKS